MTLKKWRIFITMGCAILLIATISACGGRNATPTPTPDVSAIASDVIAPTAIARSPLPTPTIPQPGTSSQDESIIFIRPNGDVVRYTLADQRETVLLKQAYFFRGESEVPLIHIISLPLRPSPDGKWLLVDTPDQGTWLAAMDGSTQRQISPNILSATWAPDSQQITYVGGQASTANTPKISTLYTHNIVAGDEARPLLKSEATIYNPVVWSPGCETTPAPTGRSCGQHIFIFSRLNDDDSPLQAALVNVATGQVTQLGPYAAPSRETAPYEFRWSPAGDEFWLPPPSTMALGNIDAIAFRLDGSTPRPVIAACDGSCFWDTRDGEEKTKSGWTIRYEPDSINTEIVVQSPAGEQFEIASDAYFAGTLAQLRSTEVANEQAEIVRLVELHHPVQWNERILPNVGVSYRLPAQWEESGSDSAKSVQNYRFAEPTGMVSLGDEQVSLSIAVTDLEDDNGVILQQWIDANAANGDAAPEQPLPNFLINDYHKRYYQVEGELITFANHPAFRLSSDMFPVAEKIVVPLKENMLEITILPSSSTDPLLQEILASFVLPSYEVATPTPIAPSPLATP